MKKDIEQLFKEALKGYEKPYDAAAWGAVKGKLPKSNGLSNTLWIGAASVAAVAVTAFFYHQYTTELPVATPEVTTEKAHAIQVPTPTKEAVAAGSNFSQHTPSTRVASNAQNPLTHTNNQLSNESNSTNVLNTQIPSEHTAPSENETNPSTEKVDNVVSPQEAFVAPRILCNTIHVCAGEAVPLHAEGLKEGYAIQWVSSQAGVIAQKAISSFNADETTQITAQVTDNKGVQHNVGSFTVYVDAINTPRIQVEQSQKYTKPYYTLSANNLTDEKLNWSMDYQQAADEKFAFYLTKKGTYPISLRVTNDKGCSKTIQQKVELTEDYNLFAENAFTPSESSNNTFLPKALLARDVNFKMSILDRAGNVLYETKDKTAPWTGKTSSGEYAKPGAYLWVVTLINEEGAPEKYTGEIVLLQ